MSKNNDIADNKNRLTELAHHHSGGNQRLYFTVMKEILHHDIMAALHRAGWSDKLTFQGGTCLRLAYSGNRLSEDLDFTCRSGVSAADVESIRATVEEVVTGRYGLPTKVKAPKEGKTDAFNTDKVSVLTWQLSVVVAPENRAIPQQKITLEVANVPSHTRQLTPIIARYPDLHSPSSHDIIPMYSQTLEEIMADKVVALANRPGDRIKNRDLWDLVWLHQRGVAPDVELIARKIDDYQIVDFEQKAEGRIAQLPTQERHKAFFDEMSRFVMPDVAERTLNQDGFVDYVMQNSATLLSNSLDQLRERNRGRDDEYTESYGPTFKM